MKDFCQVQIRVGGIHFYKGKAQGFSSPCLVRTAVGHMLIIMWFPKCFWFLITSANKGGKASLISFFVSYSLNFCKVLFQELGHSLQKIIKLFPRQEGGGSPALLWSLRKNMQAKIFREGDFFGNLPSNTGKRKREREAGLCSNCKDDLGCWQYCYFLSCVLNVILLLGIL